MDDNLRQALNSAVVDGDRAFDERMTEQRAVGVKDQKVLDDEIIRYLRIAQVSIKNIPSKIQNAIEKGFDHVDVYWIELGESKKYNCNSMSDTVTVGNLKGVAKALWQRLNELGFEPELIHHPKTGGNDKYDNWCFQVRVATVRNMIQEG